MGRDITETFLLKAYVVLRKKHVRGEAPPNTVSSTRSLIERLI